MPVGQTIGEDKMFFSEIKRDNIENWTLYTGNVNENNPMQDLIELFTLKNSSVFMDRAYEIIDVGRFANYFADAAITKKVNPFSYNYRCYFDPKNVLFQIPPLV